MWGLDGVGPGQGQVAGTCEYGDVLWVPKISGNFMLAAESVTFSRRTLLQAVIK